MFQNYENIICSRFIYEPREKKKLHNNLIYMILKNSTKTKMYIYIYIYLYFYSVKTLKNLLHLPIKMYKNFV
jgi:hypothetical protein